MHLSKSKEEEKTWSEKCLKELLFDMTPKNQIELVNGEYNIKENKETENNFDDEPNFVKKTPK